MIDHIITFIFSYTFYLYAIPVWFILWNFVFWISYNGLTIGNIVASFFMAAINPFWHFFILMVIVFIPIGLIIMFVEKQWDKIKDKRIL